MPILGLHFTNLGPFDEVEFDFDPQVNVFVGPNNCGKSTALFTLADISVHPFLVPRKLLRSKPSEFRARIAQAVRKQSVVNGTFPIQYMEEGYWNKERSARLKRIQTSLGYTTFVPALRWSTDFRSEGPVRRKKPRRNERRSELPSSVDHEVYPPEEDSDTRVTLVRDQQVVQEMIELDYRAYRHKRPSMFDVINRIASIASEITEGFPIEFAGIAEDQRGLYPEFDTPDGRLPLDVLSQGTQSLIQWLARLLIGYAKHYDFPPKLTDKPGILIIDEIDAHLHPSWQRRIIPAITAKFPSLQIFCSTHSPLMLAGLKAGQIHLLTRDAKGMVIVSRNQTDIIGWSADEIITSFLGVDDATDLKTEKNLKRLQKLRDKKRPTPKERKELESLREAVNQGMLSGPAGREVEQFAERLQRSLGETASKKPTLTTRKRKKTSARRKEGATSASPRKKK